MASDYLKPFLDGSAKFGIVGQGYVGLPLAEAFAISGIRVLGFEISRDKIAAINRGQSHVQDVASSSLKRLVAAGMIEATGDFDRLAECDAISICVPTPLSKSKAPDVSFIENATREIAKRLRPGQLIVLESTSYPGTTEELLLPEMEKSGLKVGRDVFLAFSPERVDPGNPRFGVRNTPKVIGGVTPECTARAVALYGHALETVHPVSSPAAAEMVKLLENTFRAVNIGFVNELAMMCKRLKIDVWEVIEAAKTKPFGFMPFYPGPGLGGHCIPIDPLYLSWKMMHLNYKALFIDLADNINSHMPEFVVREAMEHLNDSGKALKGSRVLVLGVAYKEGIEDVRESPALDVIGLLMTKGALVSYHDPYVPSCRVDGTVQQSQPLTEELLKQADLVLIATAHKVLDYAWVTEHAPLVLDTRNATAGLNGDGKVRKI